MGCVIDRFLPIQNVPLSRSERNAFVYRAKEELSPAFVAAMRHGHRDCFQMNTALFEAMYLMGREGHSEYCYQSNYLAAAR